MLKSVVATAAVLAVSGGAVAIAAPAAPTAPAARHVAAAQCDRTLARYPHLVEGSRGPAVRTLQCLINDWGVEKVAVDGIYGRKTRHALDQIIVRLPLTEGDPWNGDDVDAGMWVILLNHRLPRHDLARGARGTAVTDLQRTMRAAGATIAVDGVYGVQTQRVLTSFQRHWHIAQTGRFDRATREVLQYGATF